MQADQTSLTGVGRTPSENEIAAARFQGRHVAQTAKKLNM